MKRHYTRTLFTAALLLGTALPVTAADFTATWNGTTGNWSDATKWSTNPAFPNNGVNTYDAIQNGGTLTVDVPVSIDKFTLTGGTLTGTQTLTLGDMLTWSAGSMQGAGTTVVNGGAVLSGGGIKDVAAGRTVNFGDGVGAAGSLAASWTGGSILTRGVINVKADGALTNTFDGSIENNSGSPTASMNIEAGGSFTKSGGTGTTSIGTTNWFFFNNNGTVNTQTGTLLIGGAAGTSVHTGTFDISSGATLNLAGSHTLNSTASFTGAGTALFSGSVRASGTHSVSAPLTLTGTLLGTGTVNAAGPLTWSSGSMNEGGTTNILTSITLGTASAKTLETGRILNIGDGIGGAGSVTASHTAGVLNINGGSTLNVKADGAFTTNFDSTIQNTGAGVPGVFVIQTGGSFTKSGGSGTTSIGQGGLGTLYFHNNGTVNVQTGTLLIGAGALANVHTGTFNLSNGTTLNLAGTHTLNTGATFTGAASTLIISGAVSANATINIPMPTTLTGTLQGTGTVNAASAVTWSSGVMTGTGTTNVLSSITLDTAATKQLLSPRILNIGDGIGAAGSVTASHTGGLIDVRGTLTVKSDGAFTTDFDGTIQNAGAGSPSTMSIEAGGSFTKGGGTGSTLIGGGTGTLNFSNAGTVNVNSGTLTLSGGVTQHSGTTLTGGSWNVTNGASINITTGSNITTIGSGATVMLDGAGSSFAKVTTALATNQGSFTIKNDRDLTTAGAYTNSGTTRVEDSTTVMTIGAGGSAAYTQTGGVTALVNGAFIDPSVFNLNGGTLQGTGTIESSVIAGPGGSTISPGMSPGALTINGSLTLSSGSTLAMELGGLTQGSLYDFLDVNGVLTLAGMLDLDFINDFQNSLPNNEILTLATANSAILGSFSNVASGSYLMTNYPLGLQVWYGAGSPFGAENLVVAVPEPSRALLVLAGLQALWLRRRRPVPASA